MEKKRYELAFKRAAVDRLVAIIRGYYFGVAVGTAIAWQPIELRTTLFVDANVFTPAPGASSTWDYSHTITLNGIRLADGSNAPVNNFQVESASGTVYGVNGVVPEPGTWLLMLIGVAFIGMKLQRV